jgi:hypothetical protein
MQHRQKRVRLDDAEGLLDSFAANASVATASPAPDTTSDAATETAQHISSPFSPEPVRTPDKSTWQGWAEIENDPVCPYLQMSETLR